jgi:aspartyl-tRNA(Asn)/glutamyl-tRNA(Gln) amidotransferase subunit B
MNDLVPYEVVIGLEVHAQLLTRSKLFSGDPTAFGAEPNTQVSAISLGHPGTLPKLNREAVGLAVKLGLACNCSITRENYFARKNYFYPDLPKGYQISQHTTPICREGYLEVDVNGTTKKIRINRIHIEEDAGKSMHDGGSGFTNVDFNRAGMPLVEIVTEPDIRSADEAFAYVTELRRLVRHLKVCDGNMEQGSLRCDVNISVRPQGETALGTKVEVKNLNSIRFIKKAIEHESQRLIGLHRNGKPILQQTRGLDESNFTTFAIRTKEDEDDYRYFPEPDLPPFMVTEEFISALREKMPPTPAELKSNLTAEYALSDYDAAQIANDSVLVEYFGLLSKETSSYKAAANWTIGPVKNWLQANPESEFPVNPSSIAELIRLTEEGKTSFGIAVQKVFPQLVQDPATDIHSFIEANDLYLQGSSDETEKFIEAALAKFESRIPEYKKGKKGLISLFVGEVMKLSKGKVDAKLVTEKIIEKLKNCFR